MTPANHQKGKQAIFNLGPPVPLGSLRIPPPLTENRQRGGTSQARPGLLRLPRLLPHHSFVKNHIKDPRRGNDGQDVHHRQTKGHPSPESMRLPSRPQLLRRMPSSHP